ncbi:hypothetical protein [Nannocystis pusilla]
MRNTLTVASAVLLPCSASTTIWPPYWPPASTRPFSSIDAM